MSSGNGVMLYLSASHSGGIGFESRLGDWLSWPRC